MNSKQQKWALVTGASAGIGAEFCRQLAARNYSLVMVARRKPRMQELLEELRQQHGIDGLVVALDLAWATLAECFEPEELLMKQEFIDRYYPQEVHDRALEEASQDPVDSASAAV